MSIKPIVQPNLDDLVKKLVSVLTKEASPERRIHDALRLLNDVQKGGVQNTQNDDEQKPHHRLSSFSNTLIGNSSAMRAVYDAIERVANSEATVLIRGESGTGKELVAKGIHLSSTRNEGPFIPVHCAAVPESLIESTLFGYERGAFTGAIQTRKGKLEQASGGTLFLDEVGDIPLETQVKLLRVIQEREYERVGGTTNLRTDVRIVAATHRDLEAMVTTGDFREDLYYRLNVVPLVLPPLRERKEDISSLVECFLARFSRENRRRIQIDPEIMSVLARYHWPGNIRELQNCIERLVVLASSATVTLSTVPDALKDYIDHIREVTTVHSKRPGLQSEKSLPHDVQNLERDRLVQVLTDVGWVKTKAARVLGLTPRQVGYKMKKYGIRASRITS
ncbi:MAG: sigma 54-interacting transcriptional regulator [Nitrospirales bacterium]|nr:sigma 54-interacting transcriptional regulator [Nitrospira sp.]MDR4500072.1 sigma 54-interacting transcriptional regulator [Nitrospirales bacterium]